MSGRQSINQELVVERFRVIKKLVPPECILRFEADLPRNNSADSSLLFFSSESGCLVSTLMDLHVIIQFFQMVGLMLYLILFY